MVYKADGYRCPGDDGIVELDPENNGNWVRKAFLIESVLNLFTIPLITHPRTVLPYLLLHRAQITPATVLWTRSLASIFVGALTPALWTGLPNTKRAIESRRTVYVTLGLGELALIPILILQAAKGGNRDAALSVRASLVAISSLAPLLLWRIYVLYVKPEMIGRYREVKRE